MQITPNIYQIETPSDFIANVILYIENRERDLLEERFSEVFTKSATAPKVYTRSAQNSLQKLHTQP